MRLHIAVLVLGVTSANLFSGHAVGQVVRGKVVSETGEPIEGVEVYGT
jgi:hypothetical protein